MPKIKNDSVSVFSYTLRHMTGDEVTHRYAVSPRAKRITPLPDEDRAGYPQDNSALESATLEIQYRSGRVFTLDIDGSEAATLGMEKRLQRLLKEIANGRTPGGALQRSLEQMYRAWAVGRVRTPDSVAG